MESASQLEIENATSAKLPPHARIEPTYTAIMKLLICILTWSTLLSCTAIQSDLDSASSETWVSTAHDLEASFVKQVTELGTEFGRTSLITGRIVDEQGTPIIGAKFHVGVYTRTRTIASDSEGRFALGVGEGYPEGTVVHVTASAAGFVTRRFELRVGDSQERIALNRGLTLRGQLKRAGGGDFPDASKVTIRFGRSVQVTRLLEGGFEMTGFEASGQRVAVVHLRDSLPIVIENVAASTSDVIDLGSLTVERGRAIEISARDGFGVPVENAFVEVRTSRGVSLDWQGRTDADGFARILGLPSGTELELRVAPPNDFGRALRIEDDVRTLELSAEDARVDAVLRRPVLLRGTLVWNGAGVAPWNREQRLSVDAHGSRAGERLWTSNGAVPEDEGILGERDEIRFHVWVRPGDWNLELEVSSDGRVRFGASTLTLNIPKPQPGERSGELPVGPLLIE